MQEVLLYTIVSVLIVSLISLIGIVTLSIKAKKLKPLLIYLISFSAGALFGDVFFHIIPELSESGFSIQLSSMILLGIIIFFLLEKIIHWQHCHMPITKEHIHPVGIMNLVADGLHNLLDGMIIAASYLINIPLGIATTFAVILHEIPQEIGDFGILIHAGFSKTKALLLNLASALTALIGAVFVLLIKNNLNGLEIYISAIAAGGFIYIAGSDLIPELHKEVAWKRSILQIISFIIGILILASLILIE